MNLQRLRYFEAVARLGSFRRAADELNMTQPALSRQIKKLEEDDVKAPLLIRSKRRITTTAGGAYLLRKCSELLDDAAVAAKEAQRLSGAEPPPFTISLLQTLLSGIFPQAYKELKEKVGKVPPLCVLGFRTTHIITGVLHGEYDLGIVAGLTTHKRLVLTHLFDDMHVAVLPADHPMKRRAITRQWLAGAADQMVTWPRGFGIRDTNDAALADYPTRSHAAEVESLGAILELVRAGLGITVLPLSAVIPRPRGVVVRPIEGEPIVRAVSSIQRPKAVMPPFGRQLLDLMVAAVQAGQRKFQEEHKLRR